MRRVAVTLVVALMTVTLAACGSVGPTTTPTMTPFATATPLSSPTATSTPRPTPTPTVSPSPTLSPTIEPSPSPSAAPPTTTGFWQRVGDAVATSGRLRIRVIGPSPGELRYQPAASATVVDGAVVFVCLGGRAYDGQSGFTEVPGDWRCGTDALVRGFRLAGQPLDAWSSDLPLDQGISEAVEALPDGTWRWTYRATNPVFGGEVRATVVVDPSTGEIRSASRRDPTGDTTYGISYREAFPEIRLP